MPRRGYAGIVLVIAGQIMIALRYPPVSDFYFPVVWYGYVLTLDGLLHWLGRPSLWSDFRRAFLLMIPVSAGFWWLFEWFDQAVRSWHYVGAGAFTGAAFIAYASVCFSTVLPAVWVTALCANALVTRSRTAGALDLLTALLALDPSGRDPDAPRRDPRFLSWVMAAAFLFGIACLALPLAFPRYAFGLIWGSLFFLLDPINFLLGRRSLLRDFFAGRYGAILAFALAGPVCGFFWEFWNYWATIKWVYAVPYLSQLHLFEMPLPGYLGYVPFGLEAYAATVFTFAGLRAVQALFARRKRNSPRTMPSLLASPGEK